MTVFVVLCHMDGGMCDECGSESHIVAVCGSHANAVCEAKNHNEHRKKFHFHYSHAAIVEKELLEEE